VFVLVSRGLTRIKDLAELRSVAGAPNIARHCYWIVNPLSSGISSPMAGQSRSLSQIQNVRNQ
jgi:hypothetical protein